MNITIDFRSGLPIYEQIVEQVRRMVVSGVLKPGDQLPTVRQLATELRVNFNTVARAYRILDESGLISTQQGRGTYIWEKPAGEVSQTLRQRALQALAQRYLEEGARLGFGLSDLMAAMQKLADAQEVENDNEELGKERYDERKVDPSN